MNNRGQTSTETFRTAWDRLAPIGRTDSGGYRRYAWTEADRACRQWFIAEAAARDLPVRTDGNGNLWAWWGSPEDGNALVTGSHLDSVPDGGGYDGPLGVVSAFLAIDLLRERGVRPARPLGVVAFAEEEGSRFGVACLGSRLLTGSFDPDRARALRDADGVSLAEAMQRAGADPAALGPDPGLVAQLGTYLELHVEQGRALADVAAPIGVASAIWPHGRWRLDFRGQGNHAGTTRMVDRCDPMLTYAYTVLAANKEARLRGAHATIGRVSVTPNATNAIPSLVRGWLDARAADEHTLASLVEVISTRARDRSVRDSTNVHVTEESMSAATEFHGGLRDRIADLLGGPLVGTRDDSGGVPVLPTGAGHDAGVLAVHVPAAMLFVRNPTGVSHAPEEHAADADCAAGVAALATVLEELACRP